MDYMPGRLDPRFCVSLNLALRIARSIEWIGKLRERDFVAIAPWKKRYVDVRERYLLGILTLPDYSVD